MTSIDLPQKQLLTPQEVAEFLRVSVRTIYSWVDQGKMEVYRMPGKSIRIRRDVVISILTESE